MSNNKLEAEEKQEALQQDLLKNIDTSKFVVHKLVVADAAVHLKTNLETGLSSAEVQKRLQEYGTNELDAEVEKSLWERIVE
jgi:magnesium-transporting ATPase (P-type)